LTIVRNEQLTSDYLSKKPVSLWPFMIS